MAHSPALPLTHVCVHEAGHAVASLVEFADQYSIPFERVMVRTVQEMAIGPHIDRRGRPRNVAGLVEGPDHFSAVFFREVGLTAVAHPAVGEPGLALRMRKNAESAAIVALAGPAAEAKHRRIPLDRALARGVRVLCLPHVTNTMGQAGVDFEKGEADGARDALALLEHAVEAVCEFLNDE